MYIAKCWGEYMLLASKKTSEMIETNENFRIFGNSAVSQFRRLAQDHSTRYYVYWGMWETDDKELNFVAFSRNKIMGAKGNGRLALREVCQLADKLNREVMLETYVPALYPYYESFGFRFVSERPYLRDLVLRKFMRPAHAKT